MVCLGNWLSSFIDSLTLRLRDLRQSKKAGVVNLRSVFRRDKRWLFGWCSGGSFGGLAWVKSWTLCLFSSF